MTEQAFTQPQQLQPQANQPCADIFNSVDFGRFLNTEFPKDKGGSSIFLSKDNSLPSFDVPSVFKSKDAFSKMFSSSDWEMKFPRQDSPVVQKSVPSEIVVPPPENNKGALADIMQSKEWMQMKTLGSHVDVSIDRDMFSGTTPATGSAPSIPETQLPPEPPTRTNWDDMFYLQLQLVPVPQDIVSEELPQPESTARKVLPDLEDEQIAPPRQVPSTTIQHPMEDEGTEGASIHDQTIEAKKKRKRKPRKKIIPEVKVYVEPKDIDVLLGRGGRSNHHPGNKRYREEVKNLRSWYAGISDKDEKTDLSQCLVDYVHNYQGRFLDKDDNGWYEVPNIIARRKASQALREDTDPEKRAAKRARFLQKRSEAAGGEKVRV